MKPKNLGGYSPLNASICMQLGCTLGGEGFIETLESAIARPKARRMGTRRENGGVSMSNERAGIYFVGSLITSLVGAAMLLVTDFGGWVYREAVAPGLYQYPSESVWLLSGPLEFVIIGSFVALLLFAAHVSYRGLRGGKTSVSIGSLRWAYRTACTVALGSLVAGVVLFVYVIIEDPLDWWLDTGFYTGVIAGGLTALLFKLALDSESAH